MNNMIIIQHNEFRSSFKHSIHVLSYKFNVEMYKRLHGFVSRYALNHIVDEVHRMKFVSVDMSHCGCIVRSTHGLPCVYELVRYVLGGIPLQVVHLYYTMLSLNNMGQYASVP